MVNSSGIAIYHKMSLANFNIMYVVYSEEMIKFRPRKQMGPIFEWLCVCWCEHHS